MKLKKNSLYSALLACAIVAGYAAPASANVTISNWQLNLPGGVVFSGINQLNFSGESYVVNTATNTPGIYSSTDVGVFNILSYNNGNSFGFSNGGQLTGTFTANDLTDLSTGSFVFTGGTFNLYYSASTTKGTTTYGSTSANEYGATSGTQIASFTISPTFNPLTSGGFINPDGTPTANGQVSVTSQAPTTLTPTNVILDSNNQPLDLGGLVLGFITTNAHLDTSANGPTTTIDSNLVSALITETQVINPTGTNSTFNIVPTNMYISNGGQLNLQYAPEPATIALLGCGLLGIGWSLRRKMGA